MEEKAGAPPSEGKNAEEEGSELARPRYDEVTEDTPLAAAAAAAAIAAAADLGVSALITCDTPATMAAAAALGEGSLDPPLPALGEGGRCVCCLPAKTPPAAPAAAGV